MHGKIFTDLIMSIAYFDELMNKVTVHILRCVDLLKQSMGVTESALFPHGPSSDADLTKYIYTNIYIHTHIYQNLDLSLCVYIYTHTYS